MMAKVGCVFQQSIEKQGRSMVKKEEIFFRKMTVRIKKEPNIPKKVLPRSNFDSF